MMCAMSDSERGRRRGPSGPPADARRAREPSADAPAAVEPAQGAPRATAAAETASRHAGARPRTRGAPRRPSAPAQPLQGERAQSAGRKRCDSPAARASPAHARPRAPGRRRAARRRARCPRRVSSARATARSGPVQPPGGAELVASAVEIVGELAKAGLSTRRAPAQRRALAPAAPLSASRAGVRSAGDMYTAAPRRAAVAQVAAGGGPNADRARSAGANRSDQGRSAAHQMPREPVSSPRRRRRRCESRIKTPQLLLALIASRRLGSWRCAAASASRPAPAARRSRRSAPGTRKVHTTGIATWFGPGFYGKQTACGQTLTPSVVGVANRTLPCGTLIKVSYAGRSADRAGARPRALQPHRRRLGPDRRRGGSARHHRDGPHRHARGRQHPTHPRWAARRRARAKPSPVASPPARPSPPMAAQRRLVHRGRRTTGCRSRSRAGGVQPDVGMRGQRSGLASVLGAHGAADRDLQRGPRRRVAQRAAPRQALGQALGAMPIGFRREQPVPAGPLACERRSTPRRRGPAAFAARPPAACSIVAASSVSVPGSWRLMRSMSTSSTSSTAKGRPSALEALELTTDRADPRRGPCSRRSSRISISPSRARGGTGGDSSQESGRASARAPLGAVRERANATSTL